MIDLAQVTIVPIPPSKAKSDPGYDDRVLQLIKGYAEHEQADIREVLTLNASLESSHTRDKRLSPDELSAFIDVDYAVTDGMRQKVILMDDVITTGAHFVTCKDLLLATIPTLTISGIFIARTIRPSPFDGVDIDFSTWIKD